MRRDFLVRAGDLGLLLRLGLAVPGVAGCWLARCAAEGMTGAALAGVAGAGAVPGCRFTRVFSLYVVQAGSARPRGAGRACPDSVQPSW